MKSYFKKFPGNLLRGKIPALLRNKYLLATAAFLSWMLFFDDNDIISQVRLRLKLSEYESKKEYYQEKISEVKKEKEELLTNQASLEKFAREQYMMKKDNEDLFVIVPEKAKSK
jgi:cell division protein FtsB